MPALRVRRVHVHSESERRLYGEPVRELNIDNVQDGPLNAVPEPTSILLLLTMVGLTGFAKYRRTANNR